MLFIGGSIFKRKIDAFNEDDIWCKWLNHARANIHHRAKQEAGNHGRTDNYISDKNFKPITIRNPNEDGDWYDVTVWKN